MSAFFYKFHLLKTLTDLKKKHAQKTLICFNSPIGMNELGKKDDFWSMVQALPILLDILQTTGRGQNQMI